MKRNFGEATNCWFCVLPIKEEDKQTNDEVRDHYHITCKCHRVVHTH